MTEPTLRERLDRFVQRARKLEEEGLPFPTERARRAIDAMIIAGRTIDANKMLGDSEHLLDVAHQRWGPVRQQMQREERLREVAVLLGVEIPATETGGPVARDMLRSGPLSTDLLSRVRVSTSASVRALSNAILKYGISESRKLGTRIRTASGRGEDVTEATEGFRRLVRTIGARAATEVGDRLVELRREVARIPSAPAFPVRMSDEEQEVVLEARHLARRIQRIKRNARDAPSAARLMTHVRAALSEDRRVGSPQEEVEELWGEVARLTKEHQVADGPAVPNPTTPEEAGPEARRPAIPEPRPTGPEPAKSGSRRSTAGQKA